MSDEKVEIKWAKKGSKCVRRDIREEKRKETRDRWRSKKIVRRGQDERC